MNKFRLKVVIGHGLADLYDVEAETEKQAIKKLQEVIDRDEGAQDSEGIEFLSGPFEMGFDH